MDKFASQSFREKLKNKQGMRNLYKQVAFDNFIHYTFLYFPIFYIFKESIQERQGEFSIMNTVKDGLSLYSQNAVKDNLSMWAMWIPGDFVIYAIPVWMRLPANHLLSLAWIVILSAMRGEKQTAEITNNTKKEENNNKDII